MHLTAPSNWSRSIGTGGRDPSERVVTIAGMRILTTDRAVKLRLRRLRVGPEGHSRFRRGLRLDCVAWATTGVRAMLGQGRQCRQTETRGMPLARTQPVHTMFHWPCQRFSHFFIKSRYEIVMSCGKSPHVPYRRRTGKIAHRAVGDSQLLSSKAAGNIHRTDGLVPHLFAGVTGTQSFKGDS
jgi:hypothetical protein